MNVKALVFLLLAPIAASAQGFAGLGGSAEGFDTPQPGHRFDFPADHGPHPTFRIEWWYLTANLTGADGQEYGIQWTLFRSALRPFEQSGWQSPQLWMGHAGLTTPDTHFFAERLARGGIGQAGVTTDPFEAWMDEWHMRGDTIDALSLRANGADFGYDLSLTADGPLVFHGDNGYSVKSAEGQASFRNGAGLCQGFRASQKSRRRSHSSPSFKAQIQKLTFSFSLHRHVRTEGHPPVRASLFRP